jgi:hypothetical protein
VQWMLARCWHNWIQQDDQHARVRALAHRLRLACHGGFSKTLLHH